MLRTRLPERARKSVPKTIACCLFGATLASPAAGCPLANDLIQRYGISVIGFRKPLPSASKPAHYNPNSENWLIVSLAQSGNTYIADGYSHRAIIDREGALAWIYRTGGFAGVHEWYGPVKLKSVDASGCVPESKARPAGPPPTPAPHTSTALPESRVPQQQPQEKARTVENSAPLPASLP